MHDSDKIEIALDALKRIAASDPGPAYYIAKNAIEQIEGTDEPSEVT